MKKQSEFKELRIQAGFVTAKDAAYLTGTSYHTWKKWEIDKPVAPPIAFAFLDLFILTKQKAYPD